MISEIAFFGPENIDLRPKNGIVFDLIPHQLGIQLGPPPVTARGTIYIHCTY